MSMPNFKFEDMLLNVVRQRPENDILTAEALSCSLHGPHYSTEHFALSGDLLGLADPSVVGFWKALFEPYSDEAFSSWNNFTVDEQLAVFRQVRSIICAELPWLANHPILLKEVIAASLSLSFQVWLHGQTGLPDSPDFGVHPTLREHLELLPLLG